jgi:hypothetical protein
MTLSNSLHKGWRKGVAALRDQFSSGVVLWSLAILTWILYYQVNSFSSALDVAGDFKTKWGFLFSFISVSISGGLVPSVAVLVLSSHSSHARDAKGTRSWRAEVYTIGCNTAMFGLCK